MSSIQEVFKQTFPHNRNEIAQNPEKGQKNQAGSTDEKGGGPNKIVCI